MKTNPNDSINAFHGDVYTSLDGYTTSNYFNAGLTKREYFAALAMQGILANRTVQSFSNGFHVGLSEDAVKHADALIAELNK